MDKRRAPRVKKRLTCTLYHANKRYSGMVLDLSANGLFVQTSASPAPGDPIEIHVALPGEPEPLPLQGRAARRRVVPARLRTLAQGGIGVAIAGAPEAWFGFVAKLLPEEVLSPDAAEGPPKRKSTSLERRARRLALRRALGPRRLREAAQPPEPQEETKRRYRVRLKFGPRQRKIEISAANESEAREAALKAAGDGWRVLRCEPL